MSESDIDAPRVVVIGASAGGVAALVELAECLPADLDAALFVVLHLPEVETSYLADILDRAGALPAVAAVHGAPIERGVISVAPPGRHVVLGTDRVRVLRGPKVNGNRPSVDVLFHSAARTHDGHAIGVVLSGMLRDGTLGLRAIKRRGGLAIVQEDAMHRGMPSNAIENVDVDAIVPVRGIAERLTMLLESTPEAPMEDQRDTDLEAGFDITEEREAPGDPTILRCPECGGALWELEDGDLASYACHVGHTYAAESLVDEQGDAVERALWSAVRMLDERGALLRRLAKRMEQQGHERAGARFEGRAELVERQAALIRGSILDRGEAEEEVAEVAS